MQKRKLIPLGGARRLTRGGGPGPRQEVVLPDYYALDGVTAPEGEQRPSVDSHRRTK